MDKTVLRQSIDQLFQSAVDAGIPGVAAIVTNADETCYDMAFGRRNDDGGTMTTDAVLDIASMTKPIAATAAMQLVEQGILDIDAPAERYSPSIGRLKVLAGWHGETPVLRDPVRPLTLRHLLTHTAGMGYEVWSRDTALYNTRCSVPSVNCGDPASLAVALMSDPGEAWLYGIAIDWVSKIVADVTGQSFGDYIDAHILAPLGMNDTGYRITDAMRSRIGRIYVRGDDGSFIQTDRERPQHPPVEFGGAGLYSTARDYIRFVRMFLNGGTLEGTRVLRPETVRLMRRNAMANVRVVSLQSNNSRFARDLSLYPGVEQTWGLSFHINEATTHTGRLPGSLSWAGIFNTYFWIDPTAGLGGVMMTQTTPFLDPQVLEAYYGFERAVYAAAG